MNNISVFVDSLCDTDQYFDETFEKKICSISSDIFNYFMNTPEVYKKCCLKNEEYSSIVVNLILCDDEKIHEINRDYRNVDRPTDVISFAIFADSEPSERFIFDGEINLGDIFLSIETTKRQAFENGVKFDYEFFYLVAHSFLHLLGFDHQTDIDYDFMVNMQKKALEQVNV